MSSGLTRRRLASWVGTLALLAMLGLAWMYVPGAGGVVDEVRWLWGRDHVTGPLANRGMLLIDASGGPARQAVIARQLLAGDDERVVHQTLVFLVDRTRYLSPGHEPLARELIHWVRGASVRQRLDLLPARFDDDYARLDQFFPQPETAPPDEGLAERAGQGPNLASEGRGAGPSGTSPPYRHPPATAPAADTDTRWRLATLAIRTGPRRTPALWWLDTFDPNAALHERAHFLEGAYAADKLAPAGEAPFAPLATDRTPVSRLLRAVPLGALLADPEPEVRWGAGLLLAIIGDARGLPAFCDWTRHVPHGPEHVDRMMTDLFGPDWREHCESRNTTRQPGEGDADG